MYQYKSAVGRLKGINQRWTAVDVRTVSLNTLFNDYRNIWFTFHDTIRNIDVNVQLLELMNDYSNVTTNVIDWLVVVGNTALPETTAPTFVNQQVQYKHAIRAGYNVQLTDITRLNDTSIANIDLPDLALTRANTDYTLMYQTCLATVNGYVHQCDAGANGFYIKDGAVSGRLANQNDVGIYSFNDVGPLTIVPITTDMIYTPNPGDTLESGAYIRLPQSMGSKIPMVVIGGYLHVLDEVYSVIADNVIKINLLRFNLVQRYIESRDYIDLSSIVLTKSQVAPGAFIQSELLSDANIRNYLALTQSFIVLVDTPHLYSSVTYPGESDLPGRCEYHIYPTTPMRGNLGRLVEYWCRAEHYRYLLCYVPHHRKRFHLETTSYETQALFDDGQDTIKPVDRERITLLEIGRDL